MDTLFLRYEDMHSEGERMITQINDYIGMPRLSGEMVSKDVFYLDDRYRS